MSADVKTNIKQEIKDLVLYKFLQKAPTILQCKGGS